MTQKHTATPWRQTKGEFEIIAGLKGEKKLIAACNEKANAAFIVKAVNNHEALVAMVREFVQDLNNTEAHNTDIANKALSLLADIAADNGDA